MIEQIAQIFDFDQLTNLDYLIVFFVAFAESIVAVGLVFPGASIISFFGLLAFSGYGHLSALVLMAITGAVMGDGISYYLGTKGTRFFHQEAKILKLSHLYKGQDFFRKHGGKSVFLGRFIGPIRPLIPFVAGLSKMSFSTFIMWDIVSAFIWSIATVCTGFLFGQIAHWLQFSKGEMILAFFLLMILIGVIPYFITLFKNKGSR